MVTAKKKTATKTRTTKTRTKKAAPAPAPKTVLVLRTCSDAMTSSHGFQWPESGPVECADWKPTRECGNGLHGWLWGSGDWSLKFLGDSIWWLVVEVIESDVIELNGKVKFPRGNVIARFRHWQEAMALIRETLTRNANGFIEKVATGRYGHASATGDSGHASATGRSGHASATGDSGHASATGDSGHASATGRYGHASATGYSGHASATGDSGHASATGDSGHASATGNYGHASATGNGGWSVAGYEGMAKAASNGVLTLLWRDATRPRVAVAYVGENGIKADVLYAVDDKGQIVEVT